MKFNSKVKHDMSFELERLVRPNILALEPYSCARDEFKGMDAHVFLDANENPYNGPLNRYPDPLQENLKAALSSLKGVSPEKIFLGNGSDEAIDLVYRVFCEPKCDNVVAIAPTYGMYKVCADINEVEYRPVPLDENFQLNAEALLASVDAHTKVIWLCSPNNPSGNCLQRDEIVKVLRIIVLNTFSKAWASASIRLGMAFASAEIIGLFNKVKYPYNVNKLTQDKAMEMIKEVFKVERWCTQIRMEREHMLPALHELPIVKRVYPTDANFVLVRVTDANAIYHYLVERGVIVRNRSRVELCQNCLRITIGTQPENNELLAALRQYK